MKKLIIFGVEDFAQIAHEYFTEDSGYEVVAFTVDRDYITEPEFMGLPVIPFEDLAEFYSPKDHEIHVAIVYGKLNDIREAKCAAAKAEGYKLASYVSPGAFVSPSAEIGEHCFIFEGNVIQTGVKIGSNCILWSGNHIGHHSTIGNNVFISSHVVVSGWCAIGDNCFLGVNSTLANNVKIGNRCWVNPSAVIKGSIADSTLVQSVFSEHVPLNEEALFKALERATRKRQ